MVEFVSFGKIPRLERDIIITEKIDGTNAAIQIENGDVVAVQSRKRLITPEDDNYGFARWVREHAHELETLGDGVHFGEWWGRGIQRGYGLPEKRFSLFNVTRWRDNLDRPTCCSVVPLMYQGPFNQDEIRTAFANLYDGGSLAAPGFMKPEGIIVFHTAAGNLFKKTFEHDEAGKEAA